MIVDGGREASGTDPVAGQVHQLAQPVLHAGQITENACDYHRTCTASSLKGASGGRRDPTVPALGENSNQNCSHDEPGEADEGQGDPAERQRGHGEH